MSKKNIVMVFAAIGLTIGGLVPLLWGGDPLGGWSILLGFVGGMLGIWIGAKVANAVG